MIQSEISKSDLSSTRPKNSSIDSYESIEDYGINISYKTFYREDELINLKNYYEILFSKKYSDLEDICFDIQHLINISKYNLKRVTTSPKSKSITFVCSCNSRKMCATKTQNLFDDFEDSSTDSPIFKQSKSRGKKKKKVKRFNLDACHFRMRFKSNKLGNLIQFVKESYCPHNHPPSENRSIKEFALISRNIKFPLECLNFIADNINKRLSDGSPFFDKTFLKSLRESICNKYEIVLRSSDKLKKNFMKKLTYFINIVLEKFLELEKITNEKTKIFYYLYKSLSKHGGNYFRQDSLYVLNRELNFLKIEENSNIIGILFFILFIFRFHL